MTDENMERGETVDATLGQGLRAIQLLLAATLPAAAVVGVLLVGADAVYRMDPARVELAAANNNNVDFVVVKRQIEHVKEGRPTEIALLGDSSCLMGIDPLLLSRQLGRHVESYCMLGTVGPEGYAMALDWLLKGPGRPQEIVVMLHPVQFQRSKDWTAWPKFVKDSFQQATPTQPFPAGGLDYLQMSILGRSLYTPLPGAYGIYYGSDWKFTDLMRSTNGSAIDPGTGLDVNSRQVIDAAAERQRSAPPPRGKDVVSYALNDDFRDALGRLRLSLAAFGPQKVRLVISPVGDAVFPPLGAAEREAAGREIAALLGMPESAILDTPATQPVAYLSSGTHPNRWGKTVVTLELAKALVAKP